jgi:hypothetical protein
LGFKKISESYPNPLSQSKSFSKNEKPLNVWFRLQSLVIDLANALKYILSPYSHIICLTLNKMVLKLPIIYWVSKVLVKSYPNPFIPIKVFLEKWENPSFQFLLQSLMIDLANAVKYFYLIISHMGHGMAHHLT